MSATPQRQPVVSTLMVAEAVVGLSYRVAIRDNLARRTAVVEVPEPWGPDTLERWRKGDLACDCLRHELYDQATDEGLWTPDHSHNGPVRYTALWADLQDGRRVALDEPLLLN